VAELEALTLVQMHAFGTPAMGGSGSECGIGDGTGKGGIYSAVTYRVAADRQNQRSM
jgi:hypothetical protein